MLLYHYMQAVWLMIVDLLFSQHVRYVKRLPDWGSVQAGAALGDMVPRAARRVSLVFVHKRSPSTDSL